VIGWRTSTALARKPGNGQKETLVPFVGPDHSEFIYSVQVFWGKYDPSEIYGAAC
jgi:hypothetical protein